MNKIKIINFSHTFDIDSVVNRTNIHYGMQNKALRRTCEIFAKQKSCKDISQGRARKVYAKIAKN